MARIATSIEESKRLLELGFDSKSADMRWYREQKWFPYELQPYPYNESIITNKLDNEFILPAWSLSALLELIPPYIGEFKDGVDFGLSKSVNGKWYSAHYLKTSDNGELSAVYVKTGDTSIDACYEMILELHKNKLI